jgi:hypothetical protein
MTDFPAENAAATAGTALTERSGAAIATDTVPAGAVILARNTGAVTHTLTLPSAWVVDGRTVTARTVVLTAAQIKAFRVRPEDGDANSRVGMWNDVNGGAVTEVKYYVLGGV